ncbi:MAG TPA: hypothetical protein VHG51_16715, partial [Longimicrobiaceae bacterium]|nr:hypothetical protein [Longimicrobiaceae bacterium]
VRMLPQFMAEGEDPLAAFVKNGRFGGMIRPSRRVKILVPVIAPSDLHPLPRGTVIQGKPRYSHKWGGPKRI